MEKTCFAVTVENLQCPCPCCSHLSSGRSGLNVTSVTNKVLMVRIKVALGTIDSDSTVKVSHASDEAEIKFLIDLKEVAF